MRALILILLMVALIQTVSAYECADLGNVKIASYEVQQGYVIFSVYANDIPFKPNEEWTTQTFVLDSFGQKYTLTVKGRAEGTFGVYKHFYVNLTYPNGTVKSFELNKRVLSLGDYDIKIQYYATEFDFLDLDVFIQLDPLDASFNAPSASYRIEDFVIFNKIQFVSDQEAHLKLYYTTAEHWQEIEEAYESGDWLAIIGLQGEQVGNLANQVYGAVCSVPYVGDYACKALDVAGQSVELVMGVFYWIKLIFIDNGLLVFTLFEAMTLAYSALQSRDIFQFYRLYIKTHKALFEFIVDMLRKIIQIFTSIVQAIGSLIPFT